MSQGEGWIDRICLPLWSAGLATADYNAIYTMVGKLGESEGRRLVQTILNILATPSVHTRDA